MPDPQTLAVINQLERAIRRWRRFAFGLLAALLVIILLAGGTILASWQQIRIQRDRTEQALQKAKAQRQTAQRMLYYSQIGPAERAWSQRQGQKP
jgi:hypothetical protein